MGIIMFDIETTGINPYRSQVTLIGFKKEGKIKQLKLWEFTDEAEMILEAINEFKKFRSNDTIIGYNNIKFDIPFLLQRLEILGEMKPEYWSIFYERKWLDLYQFMGDNYRTLDLWLEKFGIKKAHPELTGRQMPEYFRKKEYEKIEAHNRDNLNTSEELYLKLKAEFPDLLESKFHGKNF